MSVRGKISLGDQRTYDAPNMAIAERGIARDPYDAGKGLIVVIAPMLKNDDQHEHLSGGDTFGTLGFL